MPKGICLSPGVREIIFRVKEFFIKEKQLGGPIIPFAKVNERVAAATGVSLHSISNITVEGKLAGALCTKIVTPRGPRKLRKDKIIMSDFDQGVLRQKINEFNRMRKEKPTLKKIYNALKEETDFKGSREIVRQYIKKNGFQYKKLKGNKVVLVDTHEKAADQAKCQQCDKPDLFSVGVLLLEMVFKSDISQDRSGAKTNLDSSNSGPALVECDPHRDSVWPAILCQTELPDKKDQQSEETPKDINEWVTKKLGPYLGDSNIAPCPTLYQYKVPTTNDKKSDIKKWLTHHKIEFSNDCTRAQLLEIVKMNIQEPVNAVDAIMNVLGHKEKGRNLPTVPGWGEDDEDNYSKYLQLKRQFFKKDFLDMSTVEHNYSSKI